MKAPRSGRRRRRARGKGGGARLSALVLAGLVSTTATASAEETPILHAEHAHGRGEFAIAVIAEAVLLIRGQVLQSGHEDLALLAQSARDERDPDALVDVARHHDTRADRLVVGMRVDEEDSPVGHGTQA